MNFWEFLNQPISICYGIIVVAAVVCIVVTIPDIIKAFKKQ